MGAAPYSRAFSESARSWVTEPQLRNQHAQRLPLGDERQQVRDFVHQHQWHWKSQIVLLPIDGLDSAQRDRVVVTAAVAHHARVGLAEPVGIALRTSPARLLPLVLLPFAQRRPIVGA